MNRLLFPLIALGLGGALGCGDEEKKEVGNNPAECARGFTGNTGFGSCSEQQIKDYSQCVEQACQSQYKSCFGPDYRSGDYAGPCADYSECLGGCSCEDDRCRAACEQPPACTTCMAGFSSCGLSCATKIACALPGGGDGGAGSDEACDDLAACCESISDDRQSLQCKMAHAQLSTFGVSAACASALNVYCP